MAKTEDKAGDKAGDITGHDEASRSFIDGLVARGEAARVGPDGALPSGATHEIVGDGPDGRPILRRRRFN